MSMLTFDIPEFEEWAKDARIVKVLYHTQHMRIEVTYLDAGHMTEVHKHDNVDELYYILEGSGVFVQPRAEKIAMNPGGPSRSFELEEVEIKPGRCFLFPAQMYHQVRARTRIVAFKVLAATDISVNVGDTFPAWDKAAPTTPMPSKK